MNICHNRDLFVEADNDDIKQITTDLCLTTAQRLKLRKAIRSLKNRNSSRSRSGSGSRSDVMDNDDEQRLSKYQKKSKVNGRSDSIFITEKEKDCMMQLSSFEKKLNEFANIIKRKKIELDEERKIKEKQIEDECILLFTTIYERKKSLLDELDLIYQLKLDKFEQSQSKLENILEDTKKTQKECSKLLLGQTGMDVNQNIFQINAIEKKIMSITDRCLQPISPININTKIKVDIKNKDIIQVFIERKTVYIHTCISGDLMQSAFI